MPLVKYICPVCGYEKETLKKKTPKCNHNQEKEGEPNPVAEMEKAIEAPGTKLMETTDPATNKKRPKDLQKQLRARSRAHARDVEADELIQLNKANDLAKSTLLNKDGKRRNKIDDM